MKSKIIIRNIQFFVCMIKNVAAIFDDTDLVLHIIREGNFVGVIAQKSTCTCNQGAPSCESLLVFLPHQ